MEARNISGLVAVLAADSINRSVTYIFFIYTFNCIQAFEFKNYFR